MLQSLRLSARAVTRSLWLVSLALGLAAAVAVLWLPVQLFPGAMLARGLATVRGGEPAELAASGLAALLAPRTLFTLGGLWLAALLLQGSLRVLWLGGALASLGEELSGRRWPAFAAGAVWSYPRLLGTALLGAVAEAAALGAALAVGWSIVALAAREGRGGMPLALAAAAAGTGAVLLPTLVGLLVDASLARVALRGERPLAALASAALRLGARPAAFLAVALAVGAGALVLGGSVQTMGAVAVELLAPRLPPVLLLVPQVGLGALGAMVAALFELWRLGAVAALACHVQPGE